MNPGLGAVHKLCNPLRGGRGLALVLHQGINVTDKSDRTSSALCSFLRLFVGKGQGKVCDMITLVDSL